MVAQAASLDNPQQTPTSAGGRSDFMMDLSLKLQHLLAARLSVHAAA
jgi:hypothetical protein